MFSVAVVDIVQMVFAFCFVHKKVLLSSMQKETKTIYTILRRGNIFFTQKMSKQAKQNS